MPRFVLTSLSKSRQNLEIVEIRQVHRVMYISSVTGRKVFLCDNISFGAYFSAVLVWLKKAASLIQKYGLKLVGLRLFD